MIVNVQDLWKRYGRFDALNGVTILMNLLEPSRGGAAILGVDSRSISLRELADIGYVSESQDLPGRLTVGEYLDYLRPFYRRCDHGLEMSMRCDMQLPSARKIRDLSHGMRIKMALVCALPFRPRLLILDEPFAGLGAPPAGR